MTDPKRTIGAAAVTVMLLSLGAWAEKSEPTGLADYLTEKGIETHGFYELRGGYRLVDDKYQKDMSIMEARAQVDMFSYFDWGDFKFKADVYGDAVRDGTVFDLRELNIFARPMEFMDVKIGRQPLTWGTGDLIFINDMFPKDWQSFFIGRDVEYLKAPSDAVKVSLFHDWMNLDVVYTPQFDPDRYITGERISYYSPPLGRLAGRDAIVAIGEPDNWFDDDELAVRLYRDISNYELAFYGYWGFWKGPAAAVIPDLNVYGMSLRGPLGRGIANLEVGYYDSDDDRNGANPLINNSEMRYLVGYSREIGRDLTAGIQYYIEQMLDYDQYLANLPGGPARDEFRHLTTLRLTKLLMNQNLRLSWFTYLSPTDKDVYMRPNANYKASDNLAFEIGSNIFFGDHINTFFGQFQDNTNLYLAVRYSF